MRTLLFSSEIMIVWFENVNFFIRLPLFLLLSKWNKTVECSASFATIKAHINRQRIFRIVSPSAGFTVGMIMKYGWELVRQLRIQYGADTEVDVHLIATSFHYESFYFFCSTCFEGKVAYQRIALWVFIAFSRGFSFLSSSIWASGFTILLTHKIKKIFFQLLKQRKNTQLSFVRESSRSWGIFLN